MDNRILVGMHYIYIREVFTSSVRYCGLCIIIFEHGSCVKLMMVYQSH